MHQKKQVSKRKQKYPRRQIITVPPDPQLREQALKETDKFALLNGREIAVGKTLYQQRGLWLVWISTNGLDFTIICAHQEETKATEAVETIKKAALSGDLADKEKVGLILTPLEGVS
jgi:hypothetical protein